MESHKGSFRSLTFKSKTPRKTSREWHPPKTTPLRKLTWLAGKSTMNEDDNVLSIENGDFPASHVSFHGCNILKWMFWVSGESCGRKVFLVETMTSTRMDTLK